MGISAARVCQHERSAMRRLQQSLHPFRPGHDSEPVVVTPRMRRFREREPGSAPVQCRWLRVTHLTGNGVFPLETVCFAFNELRMIHEREYRPPVVFGEQVGFISAAAMDGGGLLVGVCLAGTGRTLERIAGGSVALKVVILHDVPVIAGGVLETEPLQGS